MTTATLFSPLRLGALELPNRVVMAPLTRNRSPNAIPTALAAEYYAQRASPLDGAGLIISEATAISPQGQGYADVPGLYGTEQLDGWKHVTHAVHAEGGHIFCQLWHVGRISHHLLQPGGAAPVAPSAITAQAKTYLVDAQGHGAFVPTSAPRALHREEIPGIVHDFAVAARNAVQSAGFDGVEIHGANGYLLDQFLKTGANHRTDDYGGSIANRARLLLEVTRAVADAVGPERVGIRLSPVTPANDIVDADPQPLFDYVAKHLAPLGLAYVHVIEGATGGPREVAGRPFDYARLKAAYRDAGGHGAWMVNNGYDPLLAEDAIASGRADLVAFGKAFISMPDLTERIRRGGPFQDVDKATMYGGGARGYTDYPTLD
ncbi:alkene reductase [Ottowia oryzae]|uniref:Alkene reductase n=2 Tax=Ottowia oryzae TaxID=2109914 RepID=A0A2S0MBS2_9BURK|nr:alkene reductase [Ottowia oryzae]